MERHKFHRDVYCYTNLHDHNDFPYPTSLELGGPLSSWIWPSSAMTPSDPVAFSQIYDKVLVWSDEVVVNAFLALNHITNKLFGSMITLVRTSKKVFNLLANSNS